MLRNASSSSDLVILIVMVTYLENRLISGIPLSRDLRKTDRFVYPEMDLGQAKWSVNPVDIEFQTKVWTIVFSDYHYDGIMEEKRKSTNTHLISESQELILFFRFPSAILKTAIYTNHKNFIALDTRIMYATPYT